MVTHIRHLVRALLTYAVTSSTLLATPSNKTMDVFYIKNIQSEVSHEETPA